MLSYVNSSIARRWKQVLTSACKNT